MSKYFSNMAYKGLHSVYILKFLAVMFNILQMCSCFKYNSMVGEYLLTIFMNFL